jgi:uncharacterized protein (DUF1330 family)
MPKAYVICDIDVTDPETYEDYRKLSGPSVEQYGGRYLVRGGRVDALEGGWRPHRVVVTEFEDADAARRWYSSPEYTAARAIRQTAATSSFILVEGV